MGTAELSCASLEKLVGRLQPAMTGRMPVPLFRRRRGHTAGQTEGPRLEIAAVARQITRAQTESARAPARPRPRRTIHRRIARVAAGFDCRRRLRTILPPAILDLPKFGCLNVHTSLLPKYRGAAPIQWAIANGETETGVTVMKMDAGLDTGPIVSQRRTPILPADDSATLHDRLARLGAELLAQTIPDFVAGKIQPQPQPVAGVSHAPKIKKEDGRIDWSLPAKTIWNRLRAFTPWPGAFTFLGAPSTDSAQPDCAGSRRDGARRTKAAFAENLEGGNRRAFRQSRRNFVSGQKRNRCRLRRKMRCGFWNCSAKADGG